MKRQRLDVARVFERVFDVYRDQFGLFVPAALVLFVPIAIVTGILVVGLGDAGVVIAGLLSLAATWWFHGMVIEAVRDILDGRRDHTVGSLFRAVAPVFGALVAVIIVLVIAVAVALVVGAFPGVIVLGILQPASTVEVIVVVAVLAVGAIPALMVLTIWAVLTPVVVVERPGVFAALGRSPKLVWGHGWQVFGVVVVVVVIQTVLRGLVQRIATLATDSFVGPTAAELIVNVFVVPVSALAAAIVYFELRRLRGEPAVAGGASPPATPQVQPGPPQPPPGPTPPAA